MDTTLQLLPLLKRLNDNAVEYCVIGGIAATVHGSVRVTFDLDVCAPLDDANVPRILAALRGIHPTHRMRPDRVLPVNDDPMELRGFKNLYVLTDLGIVDFLGEVEGVGSFAEVVKHSMVADLGGVVCRVLDLDALIAAKRTANRPKDRPVVAELEVIRKRLSETSEDESAGP